MNDVALFSKDSVKKQAAQFIRSLTEFSSTLDTLPSERWLTLQLKYVEATPDDYEPEYFCAADGSAFSRESLPLVISIGGIKTPNVDMKIKYAGLESLLFEDICKVVTNVDKRSRRVTSDMEGPPSKPKPILLSAKAHDTSSQECEWSAAQDDDARQEEMIGAGSVNQLQSQLDELSIKKRESEVVQQIKTYITQVLYSSSQTPIYSSYTYICRGVMLYTNSRHPTLPPPLTYQRLRRLSKSTITQ